MPNDPLRPGSSTPRPEPPTGQAIESFSDLLADCPDLESVCQTALKFTLETINRQAGALIVQSQQDREPLLQVEQDLPEEWIAQLSDPQSLLRKVAWNKLLSGGYLIGDTSMPDLAAAIAIPARSGPQGILLARGTPCSPVEIDWLLKLSRPMGRALRMSRSNQIHQRNTQGIGSLQTSLNNLRTEANLETILHHLIHAIRKLLDVEQTVITLIDDADEWMTRRALDKDDNWLIQVDSLHGAGLLRECILNGQSLRVNQVAQDARFNPSCDALPGEFVNSLLCVPLKVDDYVLGAILATNKRSAEFGTSDLDLLTLVSGVSASTLQGARLLQQLRIAEADREANRWELAHFRRTLQALMENIPACVYIVDSSLQLTYLNPIAAARSGQPSGQFLGKPCYEALYQRQEPCPECKIAESIATGSATYRTTSRRHALDDNTEWEIYSYPILDETNQVRQVILFEQDVSDKTQLESVLIQSSKLESLGKMTASVAHEINNPLTVIIANAQILQRELPAGDERLESVDLISMAGARAAQVVRNLLDFARKEQPQHILTNINETLRHSLVLVQHELATHAITLEFNPDDQIPSILANGDSLQGVWVNLLLNAVESIDKSPGILRVSTQYVDEEIHISIADNGRGIPTERLQRIFEPFYTTKSPGRGTGLGLSVANRIVQQHNGRILVQSQIGSGTEFTVVLPVR